MPSNVAAPMSRPRSGCTSNSRPPPLTTRSRRVPRAGPSVSTKESTRTTWASAPTRCSAAAAGSPKISPNGTQLHVARAEVLEDHQVVGATEVADPDALRGGRRRHEELVLAELSVAENGGRGRVEGAEGAVSLDDDGAVGVGLGDRHRLPGLDRQLLGAERTRAVHDPLLGVPGTAGRLRRLGLVGPHEPVGHEGRVGVLLPVKQVEDEVEVTVVV